MDILGFSCLGNPLIYTTPSHVNQWLLNVIDILWPLVATLLLVTSYSKASSDYRKSLHLAEEQSCVYAPVKPYLVIFTHHFMYKFNKIDIKCIPGRFWDEDFITTETEQPTQFPCMSFLDVLSKLDPAGIFPNKSKCAASNSVFQCFHFQKLNETLNTILYMNLSIHSTHPCTQRCAC